MLSCIVGEPAIQPQWSQRQLNSHVQISMLRHIFISIFLFLSSCASTSKVHPHWILLNYADFGPQVIAQEIIGMEWWQWQDHGGSAHRDYAIKVIVHKNVPEETVRQEFPVNPEKQADYRYVEYRVALAYLEEKIDEDIMESVASQLKITRETIIRHFD